MGSGAGERIRDENMREQDGRIGTGTDRDSDERDIFIEWVIMGLGKTLVPGKFSGIHKDDPR